MALRLPIALPQKRVESKDKLLQAPAGDTLKEVDILPVRCPRCGEAQNTLEGSHDPFSDQAQVGCMVCGYTFTSVEYRQLMAERQQEFAPLRIKAE